MTNQTMTEVNPCPTCGYQIDRVNRINNENARLQADNRRWSKVADERSKENCALRQLLRDARDDVRPDVLARIDAALRNAEQEVRTDDFSPENDPFPNA